MLNIPRMAELFGGQGRFRALQCLYEQPGREYGTRELAAAAAIDPSNASRWLRRWAEVGLVERHEARGSTLFSAASDPSLAPLVQLMQEASQTVEVLRKRVYALGRTIEAAAIFGSAARGTAGPESDIDLLLITSLPRLKAQALFKVAGRDLGRAVNILAYTPPAWQKAVDSGDTLAVEILGQALFTLKGNLHGASAA